MTSGEPGSVVVPIFNEKIGDAGEFGAIEGVPRQVSEIVKPGRSIATPDVEFDAIQRRQFLKFPLIGRLDPLTK